MSSALKQVFRRTVSAAARPVAASLPPSPPSSSSPSLPLSSSPVSKSSSPLSSSSISDLVAIDKDAQQYFNLQTPTLYAPRRDSVEIGIDPFILSRTAVQNKILSHDCRRLLITSPPASGKTSLMILLADRLEKEFQGQKRVLVLTGRRAPDHNAFDWFIQRIKKSLPETTKYKDELDCAMNAFDYIFIDEAQSLYSHLDLWDAIVKHPGSARVVFFASITPESMNSVTPSIPGRMTWQDLQLSKEEEEEFCSRLLGHPSVEPYRPWLAELLPMFCQEANGHLGILRLVTYNIMMNSVPRQGQGDDKTELIHKVERHYFGTLFNLEICNRFVNKLKFSEKEREILWKILTEEKVEAPKPRTVMDTDSDEEDIAKRRLIKAVIVVPTLDPKDQTKKILTFITPFHQRYLFRDIFPSSILPQDFQRQYSSDIDKWVEDVLKHFEPQHLRNQSSWGTGSARLPLETVLKHEFWKAACLLLPPSYHIAAEVSKLMTRKTQGRCRSDFWINSPLNWAIELLSDETDLPEHIQSFQKEGKYYDLRPSEWRVISFTTTEPRLRTDRLITVQFSPDFSSATLYIGQETKKKIHLKGLSAHDHSSSSFSMFSFSGLLQFFNKLFLR